MDFNSFSVLCRLLPKYLLLSPFPYLSWQTHQEQGRSYKEVCAPVIERLRFLFNELRPAVCSDLSIMSTFKLLGSLPRWRRIAQKIIRERRKKRGNNGKSWNILLQCILSEPLAESATSEGSF